jgi:hypothetical protein
MTPEALRRPPSTTFPNGQPPAGNFKISRSNLGKSHAGRHRRVAFLKIDPRPTLRIPEKPPNALTVRKVKIIQIAKFSD